MELIVQLQELRWALQALAQPARVQLSLFPDFVCKADELALDFDNWRLAVLGNPSSRLTDEQRAALQQVDAVLEAMSGSDNPFWDEEALSKSAEWDRGQAARGACARSIRMALGRTAEGQGGLCSSGPSLLPCRTRVSFRGT